MAQREFDITIDASGNVELHISGFKGKSCLEVVKYFEKIIGEVKARQLTSEFYEPDEQVRFNIENKNSAQ